MSPYAQWLVDTTWRIGPTMAGDAIPPTEVESWCRLTRMRLRVGEIDSVRAISGAFVAALHEFRDEKCPAPYMSDLGRERAVREASALRMAQAKALTAKAEIEERVRKAQAEMRAAAKARIAESTSQPSD